MKHAHAQYDDLIGTAAADQHGADRGLRQLAEAVGIDTSRHFPVGLETSGIPAELAAIFAIDMHGVGETTFQSVQNHIRADPAKVKGVRFEIATNDPRLEEYLKRLAVSLRLRDMRDLEAVTFEDQPIPLKD